MVVKKFIRFIINKFLNNYIEELDYERLKLDFGHGHVCLEQLHLKPESLVDLGLPVTVAVGYIEKLSLTIPWTHIYTHPTKVSIDGLYMLIVPKNEVPRDLTEYHAEKMRRVQRKVDNLRKAASTTKKFDEKETTLFERMKLQIMQNLHITIHNVHISYETMSTSKLGHPFSFGLTIYHLELITTTNKKPNEKAKENSQVIFMMKRIESLALYWNTHCQSRISMTFDEVVNDLKSKIASNTYRPQTDQMNYLLYPVDLKIDFTLTLQPNEFNFERPAYSVNIFIETMDLNIDPRQFSDLLDFIKFQNYSILYDRCREYRELQIQLASGHIELTIEQKERLQILESKLDVFNLAYIRHSVELELNQSHSSEVTHRTKYWRHWWKSKHHSRSCQDHRKSSISSSTISHSDILTNDSISIDISVKVNKLGLNLSLPTEITNGNLRHKEILCPIEITDAIINFKRRAISSNVLFLISLQSFSIYGMKKTSAAGRPSLVTAKSLQSSYPQVQSEFELSPIHKRSDYRFNLIIQPLQIIYDAPTINQIVSCFDPNHDRWLSMSVVVKHRTWQHMEEDLKHGKIFDLNVQLQGISLLLPAQGLLEKHSSLIRVDFDRLEFKSSFDTTEVKSIPLNNNDLRFYSKYKLRWYNLQVSYFGSSSDIFLEKLSAYLIRRIPILELTFYKCIYWDDANLFDWYVFLNAIPFNEIQLSTLMINRLIYHLQSIPSLYENLSETLRRINLYCTMLTIFLPQTSLHFDLSIRHCILLFELKHVQASIHLDIDGYMVKTRNTNVLNNGRRIEIKNITLSYASSGCEHRQSFYVVFKSQSNLIIDDNDLTAIF